VRELRRGVEAEDTAALAAAGVFGTRRRVINPWPTVHRFVVIQ
jgi:hypothetical protein